MLDLIEEGKRLAKKYNAMYVRWGEIHILLETIFIDRVQITHFGVENDKMWFYWDIKYIDRPRTPRNKKKVKRVKKVENTKRVIRTTPHHHRVAEWKKERHESFVSLQKQGIKDGIVGPICSVRPNVNKCRACKDYYRCFGNPSRGLRSSDPYWNRDAPHPDKTDIEKIILENNISHRMARIICELRERIRKLSHKEVSSLYRDMCQEDGAQFAEMVFDGIGKA